MLHFARRQYSTSTIQSSSTIQSNNNHNIDHHHHKLLEHHVRNTARVRESLWRAIRNASVRLQCQLVVCKAVHPLQLVERNRRNVLVRPNVRKPRHTVRQWGLPHETQQQSQHPSSLQSRSTSDSKDGDITAQPYRFDVQVRAHPVIVWRGCRFFQVRANLHAAVNTHSSTLTCTRHLVIPTIKYRHPPQYREATVSYSHDTHIVIKNRC
jgi:hypothetical protein